MHNTKFKHPAEKFIFKYFADYGTKISELVGLFCIIIRFLSSDQV